MTTSQILHILMNVLADRMLLVFTLVLNFSLFAYALYQPDLMRIAIAAIFSVTVFIPILRKEKSYGKQTSSDRSESDREAA